MPRLQAITALTILIACLTLPVPAGASDLRSWKLLAESPPFPPTFEAPVGVYDPLRQRVLVMDVGFSSDPIEVVAFQPAPAPSWSLLAASGTPPGRHYLASVVYDPVRDRLLLIGYADFGGDVDVWALTLAGVPTWRKLVTRGIAPPARSGHSTIYDPIHDRVIMFGGATGSYPTRYLSEVWALSLASNTWSELIPDGEAPPGREGHGAVYDPVGRRMVVFGGHYEAEVRGFWNDTWALSLGDTLVWSQILPAGPLPGARSAFGAVFDPVRRRLLVHAGINDQSGIEPDDLWALPLDGAAAWTKVVAPGLPAGCSYPVDVYDPVADRLLACGGGGFPQVSALPLAAPLAWDALLPPRPLPAPGARSRHALVRDTRRDRFLVVGGDFSRADSAQWVLRREGANPWRPLNAPAAPPIYYTTDYSQATVYDSLGDRLIVVDGPQAWSAPASAPGAWTPLGPHVPFYFYFLADPDSGIGWGPGVALDTRRNRLIVSGGWMEYPHSAGFTLHGVWSLSLTDPTEWVPLGQLPQPYGAAGHVTYYDPGRDRLVLLGGYQVADLHRTFGNYGAAVWTTPLDSTLAWRSLNSTSGARPPAPPVAWATFDPQFDRLIIARDSSVWVRAVDDTGPWDALEVGPPRPMVSSAVAYDPSGHRLLAPFAPALGTDHVQTWALALTPHMPRFASAETLVATDGARLELVGARPNPALGGFAIAFSLPGAGPARLDVYDVRGRRCLSRDVGTLGPGVHTLPLDASRAWHPGVYFARLTRGGEVRTARMVLMR